MRLCVLAGCLVAAGCVTASNYNVVIKNNSPAGIDNAHVLYGRFVSAGGVLSSGAYSVHLCPEYPIPSQATVQWRTEDSVMHKQEVAVKSKLPPRFEGEIYFEIDGSNNVTVIPKPFR